MAAPKKLKNRFASLKLRLTSTPDKPWREYKDLKDGWKKEYYKKLLEEIKQTAETILKFDSVNSKTVNIMMLGYIQSGKSSTINSYFSILNDKIAKLAKSGESGETYTQTYSSYKGHNELETVVFFDIMGLELAPSAGVLTDDIKSCINGEIEENYKFNPLARNERTSCSVNRKEIHCVMYCVDAETIFGEDDLIPGFEKKMAAVESELKVTVQERIVLVTKIDAICKETRKDIRKIFHSREVEKVVEKAANVFRVSLNQVFPIKNYVNEMEIDHYKNIPLLLALTKAVDFSADYLRNQAVKTENTDNTEA